MSRVICKYVDISRGVEGVLEGVRGTQGGVWLSFPLQFPSILRSHKVYPLHFPVDLEVPDISDIIMSQIYDNFELLQSLGRCFKAEI